MLFQSLYQALTSVFMFTVAHFVFIVLTKWVFNSLALKNPYFEWEVYRGRYKHQNGIFTSAREVIFLSALVCYFVSVDLYKCVSRLFSLTLRFLHFCEFLKKMERS